MLAPPITYGVFAGLTVVFFGIATTTSVLVIFVLLAFAAGGISALAMSQRIHTTFLFSLLLPVMLDSFILGTNQSITLGLLTFLNILFLRKKGKAANSAFVDLFEQGFALRSTVKTLEANQSELLEANESMKLVLDNIEQGLCVIDTDGIVTSHSSRAFDTWFGATTAGEQPHRSHRQSRIRRMIRRLDRDAA